VARQDSIRPFHGRRVLDLDTTIQGSAAKPCKSGLGWLVSSWATKNCHFDDLGPFLSTQWMIARRTSWACGPYARLGWLVGSWPMRMKREHDVEADCRAASFAKTYLQDARAMSTVFRVLEASNNVCACAVFGWRL
jgi:hypothetical protein